MEIDDVQTYRPLVGSAISDDGRWAALVSPSFDANLGRKRMVMMARDLDGHASWFNTGPAEALDIYCPSFSANGQHIAGLADIPLKTTAWIQALGNSDRTIQALTDTPTASSALKWWGHTETLACLGDDENGWRRVWRWPDLHSAPQTVDPGGQHVGDFAVTPDGNQMAWLAIPSFNAPSGEGVRIHILNLVNGEDKCLELPLAPIGYLSFSPDGSKLAFQARPTGDKLSAARLWTVSQASDWAEAQCLSQELDGWITGYDWCASGESLTIALVQGVEGRFATLKNDGTITRVWSVADRYLSGPHNDRSRGRQLFLRQASDEPQELWLTEEGTTNFQRLTDLNDTFQSLAVAETVTWQAADDMPLQGILMMPQECESPPPLIVWIHGGPAEHIAHTFSPYFQVFCQAGYAVFCPNYRGSTGRDQSFLRASVGDLGGADVEDIISGVQAVLADQAIDKSRVELVGWSYGGSLALHAASRSDLFHRMVVGAPVVDWVGFFGAPRLPALYRAYFTEPFWENRGAYDEASPITTISKITTPTLIIHGAHDKLVPLSQSRLAYRTFKARDIETDLMVYPDEGHVPASSPAVSDMLHRILGWLEPSQE